MTPRELASDVLEQTPGAAVAACLLESAGVEVPPC